MLLSGAFIAVLAVTLFFGLRPKGYDFSNNVQLLREKNGAHFGRYGLLYANLDKELFTDQHANQGITIEIALQPKRFTANRFQLILTLHDGNDQNQFMIGQWKSSIIVMQGNDYTNTTHTPRIRYDIPPDPDKPYLLSLTSGKNGSRLYINGKPSGYQPNLLIDPSGFKHPGLTIGNGVYGKHPWYGWVYGMRIYGSELSPETIESHYGSWQPDRDLGHSFTGHPILLYLFDEHKGNSIADPIHDRYPLLRPPVPFLEKIVMSSPLTYSGATESLIKDLLINLFGFVPLGIVLSAWLSNSGLSTRNSFLYTVLLCFCLSLGIEIMQAWMPSRSSQTLDVILNTLGGLSGALAGAFVNKCDFHQKSADSG